MSDHVAALRRSRLFHVRQLRIFRTSLTFEAAKTLLHAYISSRVDYCNSLLYGIRDGVLMMTLQTVQNAAVRVMTGTRTFDRISAVLRQLHWLPVQQRITLKLATMTFKYLHDLARFTSRVFISRRQVAAAVCRQRDTRHAAH